MSIENNDGLWERQKLSLESYRTGFNLSFSDKHVISDPGDIWKISLVDNMLIQFQDLLYDSIVYFSKAYRHYLQNQKPWITDQSYYLGINLNKYPDEKDEENEFFLRRNNVRYRIFYALKWEENTSLREGVSFEGSDIAKNFFKKADEIIISNGRYTDYFFSKDKDVEKIKILSGEINKTIQSINL